MENEQHGFPPGYRFLPTDEEVLYYLSYEKKGLPIPPNTISRSEVYKSSPANIFAANQLATNETCYLFTKRTKKYPNGKRPDRNVGDGFWKATGSEEPIKDGMGSKRSLAYHEGTSKVSIKTNWLMDEYWLNGKKKEQASLNELEELVVCKIHKTSRSSKKRKRTDQSEHVNETVVKNTYQGLAEMNQRLPLSQHMQPLSQNNPSYANCYGDHVNLNEMSQLSPMIPLAASREEVFRVPYDPQPSYSGYFSSILGHDMTLNEMSQLSPMIPLAASREEVFRVPYDPQPSYSGYFSSILGHGMTFQQLLNSSDLSDDIYLKPSTSSSVLHECTWVNEENSLATNAEMDMSIQALANMSDHGICSIGEELNIFADQINGLPSFAGAAINF